MVDKFSFNGFYQRLCPVSCHSSQSMLVRRAQQDARSIEPVYRSAS